MLFKSIFNVFKKPEIVDGEYAPKLETNNNAFFATGSVVEKKTFVVKDELFRVAVEVVMETQMASVSMLQRRLKMGYSSAAKLIDEMESLGIVGPFDGSAPRKLLMTKQELENAEFIVHDNWFEKLQTSATQAAAHDFVLSDVDKMSGSQFEQWCADLLKQLDFYGVEKTGASGDQGVDILACKDGIKYAIQCKCYSKDLGNTPVQEVNAGKTIYQCHVGVVMTNQYFTSGAITAANATGVLLWDRKQVASMVEKAKSRK